MNTILETPETPRLYGDLVWLFPIITPPKDYEEECEVYVRLLRRYVQVPLKSLLNLGCGAGHHDHALKREFTVTGVDISETMLNSARKLNGDVEYSAGDMRTVRLGRTFDAVTIFDSLPYMLTEADLQAAFRTAWDHLKPGGVVLAVMDLTHETFVQNRTYCSTHSRGGVDVAYFENYYRPDPSGTRVECTLVFLIRQDGRLRIETDHHICGLFPLSVLVGLLSDVGFVVHTESYECKGTEAGTYPVLIGVKPV